jgi:putative ubiquitin-RnfH superfamily antitoxin RatB of RatAB toxin-antitoxin module
MEKIIKVGQMPGRIVEVAVEVGSTVAQVLEIAGLDATGYQIKMDGVNATLETTITETSALVLLAKLVKGNAEQLVKIGQMPGRIVEIVIDSEATIADAIELAGLTADGFQIKADGNTVTLDDKVGTANLILLAKMVKGNKTR